MQPMSDEMIIKFTEIAIYGVVAVSICMSIVVIFLSWKSSGQGEIYRVFNFKELSVVVTIVAITFALVLLALRGIIQGEAAVAILSGVAGYILGGFGQEKRKGPSSEDG